MTTWCSPFLAAVNVASIRASSLGPTCSLSNTRNNTLVSLKREQNKNDKNEWKNQGVKNPNLNCNPNPTRPLGQVVAIFHATCFLVSQGVNRFSNTLFDSNSQKKKKKQNKTKQNKTKKLNKPRKRVRVCMISKIVSPSCAGHTDWKLMLCLPRIRSFILMEWINA